MKEVLRALRRKETVDVLYRGEVVGTIFPPKKSFQKYAFFGMHADHNEASVDRVIDKLRGGRHTVKGVPFLSKEAQAVSSNWKKDMSGRKHGDSADLIRENRNR